MIIGGGEAGSMVVKEMYNNPQIHRYPVAVIDDDPKKHRMKIYGVPVVGNRCEEVGAGVWGTMA
ncbi:MAG: hypothetical protein GX114_06885 [Clostridiales bacterium]|nr:hypothetical protein [Clostridiales bacterium]